MSEAGSQEGRTENMQQLPEWVDDVRAILTKVKTTPKIYNSLTQYAQEELDMLSRLRKSGDIGELRYWEDIQEFLHDNALTDMHYGNLDLTKNIEK